MLTQLEARVYAEELIQLLPQMMHDACRACKNGVDRVVHAHRHDACMLQRKKNIDFLASKGVLLADEMMVRGKVSTRLHSRNVEYKMECLNDALDCVA